MFACFSRKKVPTALSIMNKIGEGISGPIYRVKEKKTGNYFTCKILKDKYQSRREVAILQKIKGPKLQTFYKVYKKNNKIYLLTDYICGKDLFYEACTPYKKLHSCLQNRIILEMADCIKQVHNNQFVHLDIKFENFIVYKKPFHLKLIDFGTSHPLKVGVAKLQTIAGTIGYTAPELFKGYYHQNSDIWSLGVCLWALVTGHLPFSRISFSKYPDETVMLHYAYPQKYHQQYMHLFSEPQLDIISGIFKYHPEERMSIPEIKATLQIIT